MQNQRIVFMGTASFSLSVFKMLLAENYHIVGVVTQPDRFVGRKKILTMPDIKEEALKHHIPVLQPTKVKEDYQGIVDLKPDLIITAAYGQIIPQEVLSTPRLGCINVHASLLPLYRGGAPVHYCLIEGQEKTGVTIMYMAKKMDAGDIICQKETPISRDDTVGTLYERLSCLGAQLLKESLPSIINGTNPRYPQDESLVTYAPTLSRADERLHWNNSATSIHNKVRGMNPWPGCYTCYQEKIVKLWAGYADITNDFGDNPVGTVVDITKNAIGVKASDGVFWITEFQLEGKKRIYVEDYLHGHNQFIVGTYFE